MKKVRKQVNYSPPALATKRDTNAIQQHVRSLENTVNSLGNKVDSLQEDVDEVKGTVRKLDVKFDKLFGNLDWFTGKYTKLDQEQKLLSNKVLEHTDQLDTIGQKLGIAQS